MHELIIRVLQGRASRIEVEALQTWRAADPENERQFGEISGVWDLTAGAAPRRASASVPSGQGIVMIAEQEEREPALSSPPAGPGGGRSAWLRRAALVPLAASLVGIGFGLSRLGSEEPRRIEISTGEGEAATLTLSDGSAIRVAASSRVEVDESGGEPVVMLNGRAFFGVAHDPSRRFTVRTAHGEAIVLGTRFEVRSDAEEFQVLVVEGTVRVSAGSASVDVTEGLMSRSDGSPPTISPIDEIDLRWMGTTLVFRSTPFGRALDEVADRFDMEITVEDSTLIESEITVTFADESFDYVLQVMCEVVGAQCVIEGDRAVVRQ